MKKSKIDEKARPEITVIVLNKEMEHAEVERNLKKGDKNYRMVDNEEQLVSMFDGISTVKKVVLYSPVEFKYKVLVFI